MTGKRMLITSVAVMTLAVAFLIGRTLGQNTPETNSYGRLTYQPAETPQGSNCQERTYAIYSLDDLGNDREFGKWLEGTIPTVVEPRCWSSEATTGAPVVRYYAAKKILVVYNTPAVQAKVGNFLKELKKTCAETAHSTRISPPKPAVIHADYQVEVPASQVPDATPGYPVPAPAPASRPKHLFHFIIRYEGDGIVDANVADVLKSQIKKQAEKASDASNSDDKPTCAPPPPPASSTPAKPAENEKPKGPFGTVPPSDDPRFRANPPYPSK